MGWDDDDDWPEPERDPQKLEERRRAFRETFWVRQRAQRWAYTVLAILIVAVVILALTR